LNKLQLDQGRESKECNNLAESWEKYKIDIEPKIDELQQKIDGWYDESAGTGDTTGKSRVDFVNMQRFFTIFVRSSIKDFKAILDELKEKDNNLAASLVLKNFEAAEKSITFKKNKRLTVYSVVLY